MEIATAVQKGDTTYARMYASGALRRQSLISRGRCRTKSIILLRGVTSEPTQSGAKHVVDGYRLPDNVSFRLGALLEPLGVAIHASRRAQLSRGQCILVFGAGAVGLLCAAVAKIAGATKIAIADIQEERVEFALDHGFANSGFVVPRKHGQSAADKQRIAMENMRQALIGIPGEGFDAVFECTGVEECTQSAIYVSMSPMSQCQADDCRSYLVLGAKSSLSVWVTPYKQYRCPQPRYERSTSSVPSDMPTHTQRLSSWYRAIIR